MYNLEFGASACGRKEPLGLADFEAYKKAGIGFMEISAKPEVYENYSWEEIYGYSQKTGVKIWSVHTPFHPDTLNLAHLDRNVREKTKKCYVEFLDHAKNVGAKVLVVHPSSEPIEDCDRDAAIKFSKESLSYLAGEASKRGIVIAVEDLPRTCLGNTAEELMELVSVDSRLKICFDVNHLLKQSHKHFFEVAGSKIVTLHISDYDFIDERHWLPGKGKIDWNEILDELQNIGYSNPFVYEVSLRNDDNENPEVKDYPTLSEGKANFDKLISRALI